MKLNEFKNQLNNMLGDLHINVNSKHLSKYKQNLRIEGDYVISYQTKVAKIIITVFVLKVVIINILIKINLKQKL